MSEQSVLQPMRWQSVRTVDTRYWTLMTLASVLGCNLGDDCSYCVLAAAEEYARHTAKPEGGYMSVGRGWLHQLRKR